MIADDTGNLRAGSHSVGMQRQYTGTAGRVENSQMAFLAYASCHGYTLIHREIYLPRCWTDDPARCAAARVPEQVRFATKITLARRLLARAEAAHCPARHHTGVRAALAISRSGWSDTRVAAEAQAAVRAGRREDLVRNVTRIVRLVQLPPDVRAGGHRVAQTARPHGGAVVGARATR